jgi:hypothetical protein
VRHSTPALTPPTLLLRTAGSPHILFNADNSSDVLYSISHSPAGPLGEAFFEGLAGLGWDYGSLDRIHPLQVTRRLAAAPAATSAWQQQQQPAAAVTVSAVTEQQSVEQGQQQQPPPHCTTRIAGASAVFSVYMGCCCCQG